MVLLIMGGSSSGKSEYAEHRSVELKQRNKKIQLVYAATMEPMDAESHRKIARHRKMREGKQFETRECYTHLEEFTARKNEVVLLECLSNLTANEMFGAKGRKTEIVSVLEQGIRHLIADAKDVVIVGNNVFEDGTVYDKTTTEYLKKMAELHRRIAVLADEVVEVVCGIPVCWKEKP